MCKSAAIGPARQTVNAQAYYASYRDQQRAAMKLLPAPHTVFGSDTTDHIDLLGGEGAPPTFGQPSYTFATGETLTIAQAIHTLYENPCQTHHWIQ